MAYGVLAAMFYNGRRSPAHIPPPQPRPRTAYSEQRDHYEEDSALRDLKRAGRIRSLGAIAVDPPMQPVETAYYFGPGRHEYLARRQPLPALPPMPVDSIIHLARTSLR